MNVGLWVSSRIVADHNGRVSLGEILALFEQETGEEVTPKILAMHMRQQRHERIKSAGRHRWKVAFAEDRLIQKDSPTKAPKFASAAVRETRTDPNIERLVAVTRGKSLTFDGLCDALDASPSRARALLLHAKERGYFVDVAGDTVAWNVPNHEHSTNITPLGVAPVIDGWHCVGVISDTHAGSKYCNREALQDFVKNTYGLGVRQFLHAGDMLDGCYRHGQWELSHHGIDDQISDMIDTLPQLPGLTYHAIEGNHDTTFADKVGCSVGRIIEQRFADAGRRDLFVYGTRGARLSIGGVVVELWHPKTGKAYSLSYHLQNHIRDYAVGQKPDILLAGHWHSFAHVEQRGVHAVMLPCFQTGESGFAKSLGGAPSMGGVVLRWRTTEAGTLRNFAVEHVSYYTEERPRALRG